MEKYLFRSDSYSGVLGGAFSQEQREGITINKDILCDITPGRKSFKTGLAGLIFWFLGRGFQAAAKLDSNLAKEVAGWDDGLKIMLKVDAYGPCMVMEKRNGKLHYIGSQEIEPDFGVYFKNIEVALLVLTGQMGIAQAYAEHRFYMKGDIMALGMSLVRCLYTVEAYLFPSFITKKIVKRMPEKSSNSFRVYVSTLLGI